MIWPWQKLHNSNTKKVINRDTHNSLSLSFPSTHLFVPIDEILVGDLIEDEVVEFSGLLRDSVDPRAFFLLESLMLFGGIGRKSDPFDLLFLFGDDVHRHEDVEGVVNTPPDVLLIVTMEWERGKLREALFFI